MTQVNKDFEGFLNIYKPKGPSSFFVVKKVRHLVNSKRVGHAGTLDPLASGVLVVAVGREYTKQISKIQAMKKLYTAKIKLGATSETDDSEREITLTKTTIIPDQKDIEACLNKQTGTIIQTPPKFSAKKIDGKRAYDLARKGKDMSLKPSQVVIHKIETLKYKWPDLTIKVECSKGTYIRSLARDIGIHLKTGAYLEELERTAIGFYKVEDSLKIQ